MNKTVKYIGIDTPYLQNGGVYEVKDAGIDIICLTDDNGIGVWVTKDKVEDMYVPDHIFINGVKFVPYNPTSEN